VVAVGDEVAQALELERLFRRGGGRGRLDVAAHGASRVGVDVVAVGLAAALVVRVRDREQAVVEADLRLHRVRRADPADRALYLAVGPFHGGARPRVQAGAQFQRVALGVLDDLVEAGHARPPQARLAPGHQALPALGRDLG